jgi:undecaprenyl-phosphate 4-deoxy-4-formamido-L-arabinose transferase
MKSGATPPPSISVVVPVYRSEATLPMLVERLQPVLAALANDYELVLVNDGSPDRSWEIIEQLASKHHWVRGIQLMRNYGQHNALLCGIRSARHEIIVTMDDDLQNPPEEIPQLQSKLAEGFDVVYGTPEHEQHGLWRDLASMTTKMVLQNSMGAATARQVSAFRAFRSGLRAAFAEYRSPFISIDVVLTWATTRFAAVKVRHEPRYAGASNYTLRKLMVHALNMVTGFSTLPLRLASLIGFGFTLFGLVVLAYVIISYLVRGGTTSAGFPFLASIIAIFSGTQLFVMGIIGEYLARMHFRMMERPPYAIHSTTSPVDHA